MSEKATPCHVCATVIPFGTPCWLRYTDVPGVHVVVCDDCHLIEIVREQGETA